MASTSKTVPSASSIVKPNLSSSLFTHSPTIPSSNPHFSSAVHHKSLNVSPQNFNTPISFQQQLSMFLHNCKTGNITATQAFQFFHLMMYSNPTPPLSSFTHLLSGLAKIKHYSQVFYLYNQMRLSGISPDCCTLNILLNCLCNVNRVEEAMKLYNGMLQVGKRPDVKTYGALLTGLFQGGKVGDAKKLFGVMKVYGMPCKIEKYQACLDLLPRRIIFINSTLACMEQISWRLLTLTSWVDLGSESHVLMDRWEQPLCNV
uniref:Pentacotripeptide-repeat region of PRORP domain-containing protein n=1 Tax=Cucumis sativus TaxID=3659 RepID=A0A0A0K5F6_CUCSA